MANIIPLKEESGAQFYPQTHEKAVIDSNGVNLQTKLANITTPSYVTAWDGVSTPVVANIPAGVVVTYNSTDYTGTLAASASTLNKTYLVATGTANNYYRYVTELSGSSYSWHSIGTTEINLSDYATKEELSQLSQIITDHVGYKSLDVTSAGEKQLITGLTFKAGFTYTFKLTFPAGLSADFSVRENNAVPPLVHATIATSDTKTILTFAPSEDVENCNVRLYVNNAYNGTVNLSVTTNGVVTMREEISELEADANTLNMLLGSQMQVSARVRRYKNRFGSFSLIAGNLYKFVMEFEPGLTGYLSLRDSSDSILVSGDPITATDTKSILFYTPSENLAGLYVYIYAEDDYNKDISCVVTMNGGNNYHLPTLSDWSAEKSLKIPIPKCARIHITGISQMPATKTTDAHAYMEFWDMDGNYFKKKVIANAQGSSSMAFDKKNIAIDICNDDWVGDDTFKIQFGDWVPQDSFHIKAYYLDPFRCLCPVSYELYDEMVRTYGPIKDYVWKRATINSTAITPTDTGLTLDKVDKQWTNGAKCFPAGFPCIVYFNGEFYGIFAWQLKKHRDNYRMSKNKSENIHLDPGHINTSTLFGANGNPASINWDANNGFEIRNPKSLYLMNGTKYDADTNSGELIDATSQYYNPANENHVRSAEVKAYILDLSRVMTIVRNASDVYEASQKTAADLATFKAVFETYFDPDNLMDYLIMSDVLRNFDGFDKNWQWLTYDGIKWYIGAYDLDCVMGNWFEATQTICAPLTNSHAYNGMMYVPILNYYGDALRAKYKKFRDAKIIDKDNIIGMVEDWLDRFGNTEIFEQEWDRWPNFKKNDSIMRLYKWLETSIANMDSLYVYSHN